MWGKYRDKVIYSDSERHLFETTQAVSLYSLYFRLRELLSAFTQTKSIDFCINPSDGLVELLSAFIQTRSIGFHPSHYHLRFIFFT
ncbi:hypothetical protein RhiirA4_397446 [Rhizophagus irregularis]|uniref:Uncharacterized protein n=1 Tax=Rhizophagus irregularis TaxID=588596 RepID=A0A2I1G760_9GLOM|nr:hypothetical protein RhiirA4_397446 [Rhizophagus irregularis]